MPIEIRELVIKATINQDQNKAASATNTGGADGNEEKEAIVREAVEEVLRIMESKKER
ncbi:DUF5908 family protein [Lacibacter sp. H407]|uniref:DUF5908 family protein n=1 Tax=Lacibacter sp. H407 TaxID=3133423 RepID=UPI0030C29BEE